MFNSLSLSAKLMRIGSALLVVALASIGLTLWVTWQLEGGAAAVNEAGRMRMQTWRLTSSVQAQVPQADIARLVGEFDDSLKVLRQGDPGRPLFVPWDEQVSGQFAAVESVWQVQRGLWLQKDGPAPMEALKAADTFVEAIDQFVLAIERQLSGLTAILNLFQFVMMALAIGGAVIMLYTGYLYVINPLANLRDGLKQPASPRARALLHQHRHGTHPQTRQATAQPGATALQPGWGRLNPVCRHRHRLHQPQPTAPTLP